MKCYNCAVIYTSAKSHEIGFYICGYCEHLIKDHISKEATVLPMLKCHNCGGCSQLGYIDFNKFTARYVDTFILIGKL